MRLCINKSHETILYMLSFHASLFLSTNQIFFKITDTNITSGNLQQFLRRKSNVKIILPECLKQFDEYAAKFVKILQLTSTAISTSTPKAVEAIINEASNEAIKLETKHVCHWILNCTAMHFWYSSNLYIVLFSFLLTFGFKKNFMKYSNNKLRRSIC